MTFRIGRYYRGNRDINPQQWGTPADVHSSIFANAEREGYDPGSIALCMPMWGPGDQLDYAGLKTGINNGGCTYEKNHLNLDGVDDYLSVTNSPVVTNKITLLLEFEIHTIHFPDTFWGIAGVWDTGANRRSYSIYASTGNSTLTWNISTDGGFSTATNKYVQWNNGVVLGKKYNVIATWDGTDVTLYNDGQALNLTQEGSGSGAVYNAFGPTPFQIGAHYNNGAAYREAHINVSQALLCSDVWTAEQIAYQHDNPYFLLHRQPSVFYSVPSGAITYARPGRTLYGPFYGPFCGPI